MSCEHVDSSVFGGKSRDLGEHVVNYLVCPWVFPLSFKLKESLDLLVFASVSWVLDFKG